MSNLINLCLRLSARFLNQLITVAVVAPLSIFPTVLITQLFIYIYIYRSSALFNIFSLPEATNTILVSGDCKFF